MKKKKTNLVGVVQVLAVVPPLFYGPVSEHWHKALSQA